MGVSRDLRKESFWRKLVRAQARSGLGVVAFCREHGQRESAFYWWRAELARRDAAGGEGAGAEASSLVPVHLIEEASPQRAAGLEIVLAGGRSIRVNGRVDRMALAEVLAVLEERGC